MKLKDSIYVRIAFGYVVLIFPFAIIFSYFYYATYASVKSMKIFSDLQAHPHSEILDSYLSNLEDENLVLYSIYAQNAGLQKGLSSPEMIPQKPAIANSKTCACHSDKTFMSFARKNAELAQIENLAALLKEDKECYFSQTAEVCNGLSQRRVNFQLQEEQQLSDMLAAKVFSQLKENITKESNVMIPIFYSMNELIMVENSLSLLNTLLSRLSAITNLLLLYEIHHAPVYKEKLFQQIDSLTALKNTPMFQNSDLIMITEKNECPWGDCGLFAATDQMNTEAKRLKAVLNAGQSLPGTSLQPQPYTSVTHYYQMHKQFYEQLQSLKLNKLKDFNYHFNEVFEQVSFYEHLYNNFLLLTLIAMLSGIALSYIIVKPILASISKLKHSIEIVKTGNFNISFDEIGKDEISELKIAFMKMSQTLQERENELIKRNKELAEMQASLIQSSKLSAIGMLSTGIAHELNQPLMVINSYIDLLKDEFRNNNKITDEIAVLKKQIEKMKNIIMQLSDFSRTDNKTAAININKIMDNVLAFTTSYFTTYNIEIEKEYSQALPAIVAYQSQIEQVLLNILTNAVDSIKPKQHGKIKIKTWSSDAREIGITVSDNGIGISAESLNKIFEPFYTTKEPGSGIGLGLYVSYKIIHAHRGTISVKSREDDGAEFTIILPVAFDSN